VRAFGFVPLGSGDLPLLATWLGRPHVAQWWREPADLAAVVENYGPLVEELDPTEAFIVHFDGSPIGYVQRYLIDEEPDWQSSLRLATTDAGGIGIDYLIGEPALVGMGVGRRMIAEFATACWKRYPSADRITVAVQQDNLASWKALEASGFRRVWAGHLESDDPSDEGPSFVYVAHRAGAHLEEGVNRREGT
jgi:aminoglycoside 6'-N-acetyltransferase